MATIGYLRVMATLNTLPLQKGIGAMRKQIGGLQSSLGGMAGAGLRVGAAGTVAGVAAIGYGLTRATMAAVDAETAMVRLGKVANLDGGGLTLMRDDLRDLSLELKAVPFENLLDIAIAGSRAGVANEDLIEYTRSVGKLSLALDDIPAEEISDHIAKINNVYKLGVKGAAQLGSATDKLGDTNATTGSEILAVSRRISGVAAQANLSAPGMLALSTALLATGTRAEQAGGTLTRLIIGLDTSGKLGDDAALGIQNYLTELSKLDTAGRLEALADLGITGKEDFAELNKLTGQIDAYAKSLADAENEFVTLNQSQMSYEMTLGTTRASVTDLQNQFKFFQQDLGEKMVPVFEELIELGKDINSAFEDAFDAGAIDVFTEALKDSVTTARGLRGMFGDGQEKATSNLGKSVMSGLLEFGEKINPFTRGMSDRAQEQLRQQMTDAAFNAIDKGASAQPIPMPMSDFVPAWAEDFNPSDPTEGLVKQVPSEFAGTINLLNSTIAGAMSAKSLYDQNVARDAESTLADARKRVGVEKEAVAKREVSNASVLNGVGSLAAMMGGMTAGGGLAGLVSAAVATPVNTALDQMAAGAGILTGEAVVAGRTTAANLELGSREAYSALAAFRTGATGDDALLNVNQRQLGVLQRIEQGLANQDGLGVQEV